MKRRLLGRDSRAIPMVEKSSYRLISSSSLSNCPSGSEIDGGAVCGVRGPDAVVAEDTLRLETLDLDKRTDRKSG
jgi:hypothetical protein